MKRVGLVGAHTALSEQIVACAQERGLAVEWVRATTTPFVTDDLTLVGPELLEAADALILCFDDPVTRALWAAPGSVPVLACGLPGLEGAWVEDADAVKARRIGVELGPAAPVADVLSALDLNLASVRLVAIESAAAFDKAGMDALSDQTRAVFGMQDVTPRFLPGPMAFGLWGSSAPSDQGVQDVEARTRAVLARRWPDARWSVTQLWAPTFSSELFVLDVETRGPPPDDLWKRLESGRGLRQTAEAWLPAQSAVDGDEVLLGRLEAGPTELRIVGAYDRLRRGGPTQVVAWLERWLAAGPSSDLGHNGAPGEPA